MNTFSQAWAALKNMLRAAARDPLWRHDTKVANLSDI